MPARMQMSLTAISKGRKSYKQYNCCLQHDRASIAHGFLPFTGPKRMPIALIDIMRPTAYCMGLSNI